MSLETWKREFYPEGGLGYLEGYRTTAEALEHSLRKWRGTLPENLAKHGVAFRLVAGGVVPAVAESPEEYFSFGGVNCALCVLAKDKQRNGPPGVSYCFNCPLVDCSEEWSSACGGDTGPMIRLLELVRENLIAEGEV